MKRKILLMLSMHIMLSWMLWGGLRVYQQGYNATHSKPIAMASASLDESRMQITVLHERLTLPAAWFAEDSPLHGAAFWLNDASVQLWHYLCAQAETYLVDI